MLGDSSEAIASRSELMCSSKQVGMISISSHLVCILFAHHIVFELHVTEKKKERKQTGLTKSKFSCSVFLTLLKVSGTYRSN